MSTPNTETRRHLTEDERETLAQFARLEISLQELKNRLAGMLEIDFRHVEVPGIEETSRFTTEQVIEPQQPMAERKLTSYFLLPQPGIRIEKWHIKNALDKHSREEITDNELGDWATMLLLNEAYDWEGPDEDEIAEMLNELSLRTMRREPEE